MLTTTDKLQVECMNEALREARRAEGIKTAFCVGCVITKRGSRAIISTGYSRECVGNTHAEENAITKLKQRMLEDEPSVRSTMIEEVELDLYTTMEPCSIRLSGNTSCTQRILEFNNTYRPKLTIKNVYLGVVEPSDFVDCDGIKKLSDSGINVVQVLGFSQECLKVARGHT